ncbi:MAG TPA: hypothetical protein VNN08_21785 [Thermoanaerobaculia bacterium]|nr:hypothetical protein [Thermoanaerobaculia bacterium]
MRLRLGLPLLVMLCIPELARGGSPCCTFCSDQYHQEGEFPYFEVIRTRRLIPATDIVGGEGWKRVFESCAQTERVNITASNEVTVVARGFLQLTDPTTPGVDVEYRWLLDDVPAGATFHFRVGQSGFPQGDDINIILPHVAAGRHRVAIDGRVTGEGRISLRLIFITAQGFPSARFPGDSRIDSHSTTIGGDWAVAGPSLDLVLTEAAHLYFQSYVEFAGGEAIEFRYVVDDVPLSPFPVVIPPGGGLALWDHAGGGVIAAGPHTVRLEARTDVPAVLMLAQVEAAMAPATIDGKALPSLDGTANGSLGTAHQPLNCLVVAEGGSGGTGGLGGTPACGKYDLLIDAQLPAAPLTPAGTFIDDYTGFGDGYVEIENRSHTSGVVTLTVEAIYEDGRAGTCDALIESSDTTCADPSACSTADFTLVEFAVPPGRSQKFFYTDPIHWGASAPNRIRLWARSGNCFGVSPVDLTFGRSRIGMQFVPAGSGACFSARASGRAAAPAVSASAAGSKVSLQWTLPGSPFGYSDVLRGEGDGPLTFLTRVFATSGALTDSAVRPGRTYRYQVHVLLNSTDPQFPYPFVCGFPTDAVIVSVPPIPPRRRGVRH